MTSEAGFDDLIASVAKAAEVAGADDLEQASVKQLALAWSLVGTAAGLPSEHLASGIAKQAGVPRAKLERADSRAAVLIPAEVAHRWNVLPLRCGARTVTVATANPVSSSCKRDIAWLTGREVEFEVAPPEPLQEAVVATYGPAEPWSDQRAIVDSQIPKGPHILVVDDEVGQRSLFRSVLEDKGFRVTVAKDGPTALELLAGDDSIDLVTLDYWMEEMNGLRVLQRIRTGAESSSVPVIMVTGAEDRRIEMSLFEAGADDFIVKPIDAPLFILRVNAVLRRACFKGAS